MAVGLVVFLVCGDMSGCVTAASWVCPSDGCLNASLFTCRADSEEEHVTKPIMCQIKGVQGVADHLLVRFSGMCQDYK